MGNKFCGKPGKVYFHMCSTVVPFLASGILYYFPAYFIGLATVTEHWNFLDLCCGRLSGLAACGEGHNFPSFEALGARWYCMACWYQLQLLGSNP